MKLMSGCGDTGLAITAQCGASPRTSLLTGLYELYTRYQHLPPPFSRSYFSSFGYTFVLVDTSEYLLSNNAQSKLSPPSLAWCHHGATCWCWILISHRHLVEYCLVGADEAPLDHLLLPVRVEDGVAHVEQLALVGHVRVVAVPGHVSGDGHVSRHAALTRAPRSWTRPRCSPGWSPRPPPAPAQTASAVAWCEGRLYWFTHNY